MKSQRLQVSDVRAAVRLAWEAAELRADPTRQHEHILGEGSRLLGATQGLAVRLNNYLPDAPLHGPGATTLVYAVPSVDRHPDVLRYMRAWGSAFPAKADPTTQRTLALRGQTVVAPQRSRLDERVWENNAFYEHVGELLGLTDVMPVYFRRRGGRDITSWCFHRLDGGMFGLREERLARVLVRELYHLYRTGRLEPAPSPLDTLPPRLRQVADGLLAGKTPKTIAAELGLSLHTVREYIGTVYRRLGVAGREALMVRFAQR